MAPADSLHSDHFKFWFNDLSGYIYGQTNQIKKQIVAWNEALHYADVVADSRRLYLRTSIAILRARYEVSKDLYREFKYLEKAIQPFLSPDQRPEVDLRDFNARILGELVWLLLYGSFDQIADSSFNREEELIKYSTASLNFAKSIESKNLIISAFVQNADVALYLEDWTAHEYYIGELSREAKDPHNSDASRHYAYRNVGLLDLRQANYDQAIYSFLEAVRFAEFGNHSISKIKAQTRLGYAYEFSGQQENAMAAYNRATAIIDSSLTEIGGMEWGKDGLDERLAVYLSKMRLHLQQRDTKAAYAALAERTGRYLLTMRARSSANFSAEVRTKVDTLYSQLSAIRIQQLHEPDAARERGLAVQSKAIQAEIERLLATGPASKLDIHTLQQHLGRTGQTLIHYVLPPIHEAEGPYHNWRPDDKRGAFIITQDSLVFVDLPATPISIAERLEQTSSLFSQTPRSDAPPPHHFNLAGLNQLYDQLVRPLEPWLQDTHRLLIIPDESVQRVPFAALVPDYKHAYAYDSANYLFERFAITYGIMPHQYLHETPPAPPVAAQKDITFIGYAEGYTAPNSSLILPPLPGINEERRLIEANVADVEPYNARKAVPDRLLVEGLQSRILHVAAHARPNLENPLWSEIFLHPSSSYPQGILHLYNLEGRQSSTELIVLSACHTRQGRSTAGEGMLGFHYAFHAIGIPSSIATLWQADDEAASHLFSGLYASMLNATPKDIALQQTMQRYLDEAEASYKSPFYWGGLLLTGAATPIPLQPAPPDRTWLWTLILAICITGLIYIIKHRNSPRP
ncbi:MAG: hypothetical protein RhofKO_27890 [Rhodothermales bacterium]